MLTLSAYFVSLLSLEHTEGEFSTEALCVLRSGVGLREDLISPRFDLSLNSQRQF